MDGSNSGARRMVVGYGEEYGEEDFKRIERRTIYKFHHAAPLFCKVNTCMGVF